MRTDTLNEIPGEGEKVDGLPFTVDQPRTAIRQLPTANPAISGLSVASPPTANCQPPSAILIMGIGNYLMADEGVGVHLVEHLSAMELPQGVDLLDGGTGGFHLLEYFERYPHVILVDATLDGRAPGTIRRIRPRFAADFPQAMSTHDIGLKDLVGALQLLGRMPEIDLFVVSIESIQDQGIELTPHVASVMDILAEEVLDTVKVRLKQLQ